MSFKLKDISTRVNYNLVTFIMELQRQNEHKDNSQLSKCVSWKQFYHQKYG